ncbi:MAG: HEAT repeat domain-containing protein [Spirochaetota bacterium]|nr:HEAT repeat domain-containing protein [Spirochaetota bacterium]
MFIYRISNKLVSVVLIIFTFLLISSCQSDKSLNDIISENIKSSNNVLRRIAIKIIGDKKLLNFVPELKLIIFDKSFSDEERYLASYSLGLIVQKKEINKLLLLIDGGDEILRNCGLEILISILKNRADINNSLKENYLDLGKKVTQILLDSKSPVTIRKASIIIGLLRYTKAYPKLLKLIRSGGLVYDELINTFALLGNDNTNHEIESVLLSLVTRKNDKRLERSIRKGIYIIRNDNMKLPFFDDRLMDKLSDIGSDHFITSFEAENYFRLFINDVKNIKHKLGKSETYDPKKIRKVLINRVPLLILALEDYNPKIRYKAAKLLGELGNSSCCKPLIKIYNKNKDSKTLLNVVLNSLARLNCKNAFNIIAKHDSIRKLGSPLFTYFKYSNDKISDDLFYNNPLLFSQKELFPKDVSRIKFLLAHPNSKVRIQAIYSLYGSEIKEKQKLINEYIAREKDNEIVDFLSVLVFGKKYS